MQEMQAFEQALKNFPKWMDIRKRKKTSYGGQYLRALISEVNGINEALEDYRKSFFAYNYKDEEQKILDYVLAAAVGQIDIGSFYLLSPSIPITTDPKVFANNQDEYGYYEDGFLVFSTRLDLDAIRYSYMNHEYNSTTVAQHIWNIFDEFALYTGIERQDGENNKSLLNRCLLMYKNVANASASGIKNAIMNELSQIKEIYPDQIEVGRVSEENIYMEDIEGKSVSEVIIDTDADVFRRKVWDKSLWNHNFKSLSYASHKWDEDINNRQIGTGQGNDLKTHLVSELQVEKETNVSIDVYKKSSIRVGEFLKSNQKETAINLQLKKYHEDLSPLRVDYKVTAETLVNITNEPIYVHSYERSSGNIIIPIDEISIDRPDKEYSVIDGGVIKKPGQYKLVFLPTAKYSKMEIAKINKTQNNVAISLLKESGAFRLEDNMLKNTLSAFYGDKIENFYFYKNMNNGLSGLAIEDNADEGELEIDVTGISNQYIRYESDAPFTNITFNSGYIKQSGYSVSNGAWTEDKENSEFVIEGRMNALEFSLMQGNAIIEKTIGGKKSISFANGPSKEEMVFDNPEEIRVSIRRIEGSLPLVINQVRYKHYEIDFEISEGNLLVTGQGVAIPSSSGEKRYLKIKMRSYTGYSPYFKYIYIGGSLANEKYETDIFQVADGEQITLDIESTCRVQLVESSTGKVEDHYTTSPRFKNETSDPVYVEIDMDKLSNIQSSSPAIEPITYKGRSGYYVKVNPGEELTSLFVKGEFLKMVHRKKLTDIVKVSEGSEIFASKQLKGLIVRTGNRESRIKIKKSDIDNNSNLVEIVGLPLTLVAAFVTDELNNKEVLSNSYINFDYLYISPKETRKYIAYGYEDVITKDSGQLNIPNTFYPQIPSNALISYMIETSVIGATVMFSNLKEWSVGIKPIAISMNADILMSQFETSSQDIRNNFIVSDHMELPDFIKIGDNELTIAEYTITVPNGFELDYSLQSSDYEQYYVKSSGYNKLKYSNVERILFITVDGVAVHEDKYELYEEIGIIHWLSDEYAGRVMRVHYEYKKPTYIAVRDLSLLYDIVGYSKDTLEFVGDIHYYGLSKGATLRKEEQEIINKGEHLVVRSSHPLLPARVENGTIKINSLMLPSPVNYVYAEPGYYYVSQKEWYKYKAPKVEEIGGSDGVFVHEGERINDEIVLSQSASNFLRDSRMISNTLRSVCEIDFVNNEVKNVNAMHKLTASDSYNIWELFKMDLTFDQGYNGKGIRFTPKAEEGYAVMDITNYLSEGCRFSAYASPSLGVYLVQQSLDQDLGAIYGDVIKPLSRQGDFVYVDIEDLKKSAIIVKGAGVIDDIVCANASCSLDDIHTKGINHLGFSIEETDAARVHTLLFEGSHASLDQVEINDENKIRTSTSIHWDLTPVKDYKTEWLNSIYSNVELIDERYFKTGSRSGVIYFPAFKADKFTNIQTLTVRINNVLFRDMKGFTVRVLTSSRPEENFSIIATVHDTNLVEVAGNRVGEYIKLVVEMPANSIIENVEVFARYAQKNNEISARIHTSGTLTTKIYDVGNSGKYRISNVNAKEIGKSSFYARGVRANEKSLVSTDWKRLIVDEDGIVMNEVIFDDYEYFQFMIRLESENDEVAIDSFELEAVE